MSKPKVSEGIAQKDIEKFIAGKFLDEDEIKDQESSIETIKKGLMSGVLILKEDLSIEHTLKFPVGEMKVLTYANRLTVDQIHIKMRNIDPKHVLEMLAGYAAAASGESKDKIGKMDSYDYKIARAVGSFFL